MTDKAEQPSVEVTEEVEKTKEEKVVEKPEKVENGGVEESEEPKEKSENGAEKPAEENGSADSEDKPAVKRKSTAGADDTDSVAVEGATPEKKAKLDEKESTEAKAAPEEVEA